MGEVVGWRPKPDPKLRSVKLGVLVLMGAWTTMFSSLLFVFIFIRLTEAPWPPEGTPPLPQAEGAVALGVLALAAAALRWGALQLGKGSRGRATALLAVGLLAAAGFVVERALLVVELRLLRFGGAFGTLYMTALFFHLTAAALGLPGLVVGTVKAASGQYSPARHPGPVSWAWYWAFVAGVWALLYGVLYWL